MRKDIDIPVVKDVFVAAVFEKNAHNEDVWNIYLLNNKTEPIEAVMVSSKGYSDLEGKDLRTAIMRHSIGNLPGKTAAVIERIDKQVFEIYNEFWVTFFENERVMDRKFIFGPHTIDNRFSETLPLLPTKGILVK
jgi:hypothetical protein